MTTQEWHKYSNKTDQIDGSNWEIQFYQNDSIRFGRLEFEGHGNAEFEQEMVSLEERVDRDREFAHVLSKQKLRSFFCTICLVENIAFSTSLRYT